MRIVHLTDLHLVPRGERLFALDPWARLDLALAHIERREALADLLLITGDLTDRGDRQAYADLATRLQRGPIRAVLLLGNHDDREAFRASFPDLPVDDHGFVQQAVDAESGVSLITLDTLVADAAHGELCDRRLAWLEAELDARSERAVYLAMHHPPVACGIPGMDAIGLEDATAFWQIVERRPQIRHIFAGHIHRPFFARRGAVSVSTVPAPGHQVHLQYEAPDLVLGSLEAGAYGIARLGVDGFDQHIASFTDHSPRFVFDNASNRAASLAELTPTPTAYEHLL